MSTNKFSEPDKDKLDEELDNLEDSFDSKFNKINSNFDYVC